MYIYSIHKKKHSWLWRYYTVKALKKREIPTDLKNNFIQLFTHYNPAPGLHENMNSNCHKWT